MAELRQICYQVSDGAGGWINTGWDQEQPFLDQALFGPGMKVSKLSIQAPANTVVLINNREIIIGGSGIYDLTIENALVTSLVFPSQQEPDQEKIEELEDELDPIIEALIAAVGESPDYSYKDFSEAVVKAITEDHVESIARSYLSEVNISQHGNPDTLQGVIVNYILVQEANNS